MQPLFQPISGEKIVLPSFKRLGSIPSESTFHRATITHSTTSLATIGKQTFHQCIFSGSVSSVNNLKLGVHCSSKSCLEMTPINQGSVIVIMGVCGSGKTTIGNLLAEALNCTFLDADDFHPDSNKEKMREGIPLSEDDRMPWLQALSTALKDSITSGNTVVLACSALQKTYREILRSSKEESSLAFVLLNVTTEVLSHRLHQRMEKSNHFMPPTLLESQLRLLEIDSSEGILEVDATQSPSEIVGAIQVLLSECNFLKEFKW